MSKRLVVGGLMALVLAAPCAGQITAIRAGRLIDPEAGTAAANQMVLVEDGKITAVLALPFRPVPS